MFIFLLAADTSPGLRRRSHARLVPGDVAQRQCLSLAEAAWHDLVADVTGEFLEPWSVPQFVHRENVNSLLAVVAEDGGVELATGVHLFRQTYEHFNDLGTHEVLLIIDGFVCHT